MAEGI